MKTEKNGFSMRLFGIIAFVAVIGFTLAACGDSDDFGDDDISITTGGLVFTLIDNGTAYSVSGGRERERAAEIVIPSAYNGRPVTTIAANGFQYMAMTSITIPNSVTRIGDSAFSYCYSLASITIPSSVTSIGDSAFSQCGFTSVTIPSSVTSIGDSVFSDCEHLASVTISSSITRIGNFAFAGCDSLVSVTIPSGVTSIGNSAFYGCRSLASVTIPNSVISIGDFVFSFCSLASITIPSSVTSIGQYAFDTALYSVTFEGIIPAVYFSTLAFPGDLRTKFYETNASNGTPGTYTRSYNSSTWILDLSNNGETYTRGLIFTLIDGGTAYSVSKGNASAAEVIIPPIFNGLPVTTIAATGFQGYTAMTSITIPDSVASIGASAFSGCSGLTSIIIPDSVTSIGSSAFSGCNKLTSITIPFVGYTLNGSANTHFGYIFGASSYDNQNSSIPSSLRTVIITGGNIANNAFRNCISLTSITLPDSVTSIGTSAFSGCSLLWSITIPDSVMSIGSSAFSGCNNFESITIPDSVLNIGSGAFSGCNRLTSITIPFVGNTSNGSTNTHFGYIFGASSYDGQGSSIPSSLRTVIITGGNISDLAFAGCSGLTSVTIPDSVLTIGDGAFANCTGLTDITIPDSVMSIGDYAFAGCTGLKSITVNVNNPIYASQNGILYDKVKTTIVHVPQLISGSITIPNYVTSIPDGAFDRCSGMTSITIPDSVLTIGRNSFSGCYRLTSIIIGNNVTSIGDSAFYMCEGLTSITIPASVANIGDNAFNSCSSLRSIIVNENNPIYASQDGILYDKVEKTIVHAPDSISGSITTPNYVTSIPDGAFNSRNGMTSITIPNSVTSIGEIAFYGCTGLTSVTIPSSVTSIGQLAFLGCSNLRSVTFATGSNITLTNFGSGAFPQGPNTSGDNLREAYLAGGAGTYTRAANGSIWTKQQ